MAERREIMIKIKIKKKMMGELTGVSYRAQREAGGRERRLQPAKAFSLQSSAP